METKPISAQPGLGQEPDYVLANEYGVNKTTIARRRRKSGIAPHATTSGSDGRFKPGHYPARWLKWGGS
jgi:hypothetical protein